MNHSIHHSLIIANVLLLIVFSAGCATVVTPLSTTDPILTDGNHGLLVGHIRLAWHGPDQPEGRKRPLDMKWSLEEETQGTHIVLADLPTAGPFVVKLPVGSYRVQGISFNGIWGTWHTVLPTAFQIQSGGCTSLGTWELQRESESFAAWITGHVFKHSGPTHAELHPALATRECSMRAASSESSVRTKLGFQNRHGGFEF
jgi:hypothetical protein